MRNWHRWKLLRFSFKKLFNFFDLVSEDLVDFVSRFLMHKLFYQWSLGDRVKTLEHLNSVLDSRHAVESQGGGVVVHDFNVFDLILEHLTVVIMPLGDLDIKNRVVQVSDGLKTNLKFLLKFKKVLSNFWSSTATEDWHDTVSSLSSELELSLADFFKILASLNESLILSEDSLVLVQCPLIFLSGVFLDLVLHSGANCFPLLTAVNALVEVSHAFFNISVKHIVDTDLSSTSFDDLVGDLSQETLHSLVSVVVFGELIDDSD